MSTQEDRSTDDVYDDLKDYLAEAAAEGAHRTKSKFIARKIDSSAKQVGNLMARLEDEAEDIAIDRIGRSSGVTWEVRRS